jgi:hypothetical protein
LESNRRFNVYPAPKLAEGSGQTHLEAHNTPAETDRPGSKFSFRLFKPGQFFPVKRADHIKAHLVLKL